MGWQDLAVLIVVGCAAVFLWRRFGQRLMVYGHSAGGHLAGCMVATDWKKFDPKAPVDLVPAGYAISGLFDLAPLQHTSMNVDPVDDCTFWYVNEYYQISGVPLPPPPGGDTRPWQTRIASFKLPGCN